MKLSPQGWLADALVLLAALIWGVAFYFQKTAMLHLGPFLFLGLRATIAAVALAPFAAREKGDPGILPIALLGGALFFAGAVVCALNCRATMRAAGDSVDATDRPLAAQPAE